MPKEISLCFLNFYFFLLPFLMPYILSLSSQYIINLFDEAWATPLELKHLVFPHKKLDDVKEMEDYFSGALYGRPSHSGQLLPVFAREKAKKKVGEQPLVSNKANLSKLSGLVASGTSLSEDQKETSVPLKLRKTSQVQQ